MRPLQFSDACKIYTNGVTSVFKNEPDDKPAPVGLGWFDDNIVERVYCFLAAFNMSGAINRQNMNNHQRVINFMISYYFMNVAKLHLIEVKS